VYNHATGEILQFATTEDRIKARLARMRHIVWLGVKTLEKIAVEDGGEFVMYTLTYALVDGWEPRHIGNCMRWLRRQGIQAYVWVGELQTRGAVHYHVLALLPDGQRWVKPNCTDGGWANGYTWVTPSVRYPLYIMKYLQKGGDYGNTNRFPKGFRLYAVSRWAKRRAAFQDQVDFHRCSLPRWAFTGDEDAATVLGSSRCRGGIAYGKLVGYSPYSHTPLDDVEDRKSVV
jgi:hypothetical protein